jgi:hypothetical protein
MPSQAEILARSLLDGKGESPKQFIQRMKATNLAARIPTNLTARIPTIDQVDFSIEHDYEDDISPEGDFDEETAAWVRNELEDGNTWAWCRVTVTAMHLDQSNDYNWVEYEGKDYLGGCSYRSKEDFMAPGGYYDDMKKAAYNDLVRNIEADLPAED